HETSTEDVPETRTRLYETCIVCSRLHKASEGFPRLAGGIALARRAAAEVPTMQKALAVSACAALLAACIASSTGSQSPVQVASAVMVITTQSGIMTAEITDWNAQRERVEQFYPSICVDVDNDDNGVPDTLDLDRSADDTGADANLEDRCQPC